MSAALGAPGRPLPFANAHFIAADKPAGWLSVPSRQGAADPRPCLGVTLTAELGVRLWPVHRLDAEVTGLILFALSAEAHRQANAWFEHHLIDKTYEAWTEGDGAAAPAGECVWRSTLLRGKRRAYESPRGKPAETVARCTGTALAGPPATLRWELAPRTGRPHQLRFELARHGFPILGDELYGAKARFGPGAIALRCVQLRFHRSPGAADLGLPQTLDAAPLAAPPPTGA